MKVLIVLRYFYCPSQPIGGAERQALKLAQRLIERGVGVIVVSGQWDWGQPRREKIQGISVHRHFTGWGMFNIKGLRKFGQYLYLLTLFLYLIKHRNEYDLVHCQSAMFSASMVTLANRWLHKKTLVRATTSGTWGDIERLRQGKGDGIPGTKWMLRQLRKVDRIVALNKQVFDELVGIGVQPERIVHIPNSVEIEQIMPKIDYRLESKIVVTFVGRLHSQKGVDVLLLAYKRVQETLPQFSWRLNLVGVGPVRRKLEALAHQLSIDQAVEFLGQIDDPFPILAQSDIFVLPSRSEGMSNALLEAMAHGLPCVASDIPGNNDVIVHGENGLLVRLDDDDDLTAAIASLATDQKLREKLGWAAIRTVKEKYSLDSVANQYTALYADLLHSSTDVEQSGIKEIGHRQSF